MRTTEPTRFWPALDPSMFPCGRRGSISIQTNYAKRFRKSQKQLSSTTHQIRAAKFSPRKSFFLLENWQIKPGHSSSRTKYTSTSSTHHTATLMHQHFRGYLSELAL